MHKVANWDSLWMCRSLDARLAYDTLTGVGARLLSVYNVTCIYKGRKLHIILVTTYTRTETSNTTNTQL